MGAGQVGDIGTLVQYDCGEDITDQTTLEINYKKPDGTTGTWAATVSGTDIVEYETTSATDLLEGTTIIQVYIETPAWIGHSEKKTFTIEDNI